MSAEKDAGPAYRIEGHAVDYIDHRYECRGCGARLLSLMQFNGRECPTPPVVIDITGGPLGPDERAIHAKYQSDDPAADYYDTTPLSPAETGADQ